MGITVGSHFDLVVDINRTLTIDKGTRGAADRGVTLHHRDRKSERSTEAKSFGASNVVAISIDEQIAARGQIGVTCIGFDGRIEISGSMPTRAGCAKSSRYRNDRSIGIDILGRIGIDSNIATQSGNRTIGNVSNCSAIHVIRRQSDTYGKSSSTDCDRN